MPVPTPPPSVSAEHEERVLQAALVECQRRLKICRAEGDTLGADVCESDMNHMLDRLAALIGYDAE